MNARIKTPAISAIETPPWSPELEREALGSVMLGETPPDWLRDEHFFPAQHQVVFRAARPTRRLDKTAALLREQGRLAQLNGNGIRSSELAEMCLEAEHARRMGWATEWERLRELWLQRGLLAAMDRAAVMLRGGQCNHAEAVGLLREHVRGSK